jgi:hypothetical protein
MSLQNYWVFGLFPSSGILDTRKHIIPESGSVSVLSLGGGGDNQLGFPSPVDGNRFSFRNVVFSNF